MPEIFNCLGKGLVCIFKQGLKAVFVVSPFLSSYFFRNVGFWSKSRLKLVNYSGGRVSGHPRPSARKRPEAAPCPLGHEGLTGIDSRAKPRFSIAVGIRMTRRLANGYRFRGTRAAYRLKCVIYQTQNTLEPSARLMRELLRRALPATPVMKCE